MGTYLRIYSYIRKPYLIYDCSTMNFPIYEEKFDFLFYQCGKFIYERLIIGFSLTPSIMQTVVKKHFYLSSLIYLYSCNSELFNHNRSRTLSLIGKRDGAFS